MVYLWPIPMAYAYGLYLWHAYGHGRPPHPRPARLLGAALSQRGEASPRRVHAGCGQRYVADPTVEEK